MTTTTHTQTEVRTAPRAVDMLLTLLADALSACEEQDLDLLHGRTPAGTALMSLSVIARRAAAALGADPGVHLTDGPGVVVLRDLVASTRLLAGTAHRLPAAHDAPEMHHLLAGAKGVHAALLETVTPAA